MAYTSLDLTISPTISQEIPEVCNNSAIHLLEVIHLIIHLNTHMPNVIVFTADLACGGLNVFDAD